ncbi:MAG: cobalamin biosynthesis protein, partial [Pseudomonadota bacterium]
MIVAGFGFRASADALSFEDALRRAAGRLGGSRPEAAATLAEKADAPAFARFAAGRGLRLMRVDRDAARGRPTLTRSDAALAAHGLGSVAEACALAAAGPGGG